MPWLNDSFLKIVKRAKQRILLDFSIQSSAEVLLCTQAEIVEATYSEIQDTVESIKELKLLKIHILPDLIGKYFKSKDEIWLVIGKGDNFNILIHEMLHSIQICSPHREHITEFLSFKLTDAIDLIDPYVLEDWLEVEKLVGFDEIKERFLKKGDCEDF